MRIDKKNYKIKLRGKMNKEELIQIHTLMATMKEFLEKRGKGEFLKYKAI